MSPLVLAGERPAEVWGAAAEGGREAEWRPGASVGPVSTDGAAHGGWQGPSSSRDRSMKMEKVP